MAKGLLFALVRKGSKLNYLDDGNKQSRSNESVKPLFKVNSSGGKTEHKETGLCSTQQVQMARGKVESKRRRNKLFDMTLQKLPKGRKTHRKSPVCSRTKDSFTPREIDISKSDYPFKTMVVPSIASGYFVRKFSSTNSKGSQSGTLMPRIVLTDHNSWNSAGSKTLEMNVAQIQYYSRHSSFPQLRAGEQKRRPSSWNGEDSSPHLNNASNRRSRPGSPEAGSSTSSLLSRNTTSGLYIETIPISTSPTTPRKNVGSANSLRPLGLDHNRIHSTVERHSKGVDSPSVKRARSWSRGDEKIAGFDKRQNGRKIDIFLPSM